MKPLTEWTPEEIRDSDPEDFLEALLDDEGESDYPRDSKSSSQS
jgi:hypothetical protein